MTAFGVAEYIIFVKGKYQSVRDNIMNFESITKYISFSITTADANLLIPYMNSINILCKASLVFSISVQMFVNKSVKCTQCIVLYCIMLVRVYFSICNITLLNI